MGGKVFNFSGGSGSGWTPEKIVITAQPKKTEYKVGDLFERDGMTVELYYNNGLHFETEAYSVTPSGPLKEADTAVTVSYSESGKTVSAAVDIQVTRTEIPVPVQNNSLTYSGSAQMPTWDNYDATKMTKEGSESEVDAGTYTVTFTCGEAYTFPGDQHTVDVEWTIGRATGKLTATPPSVTLEPGKLSETVTIGKTGDGTLSVENGAQDVVDAQLDDLSLTITSKDQAAGDGTVTVKMTESKNWTAAQVEIPVEAAFISKTLNDNDWAKIKAAADADQGENYWQVGDTKTIIINGKVGQTTFDSFEIDAFILGFNHNASLEGEHRIHFAIGKKDGELVGLVDSNYNSSTSSSGYFNMNYSDTNSGGWESSKMRTALLGGDVDPSQAKDGTLAKALPEDLRAIMQSVTKYTDNKAGSDYNKEVNVTDTKDWLWLFAEYEIQGTRAYANQYEQAKQQRYAYFEAGNPKIIHKHNDPKTAAWAWCRSPNYYYSNYFCNVYSGGSAGSYSASWCYAVVAGFAV